MRAPDFSQLAAAGPGVHTWRAQPASEIVGCALPHLGLGDRLLLRALALLASRRAIGIFPEGEVNRDPVRLLRGRRGAARLSLETGTPVVPMGIRFPGSDPARPIGGQAGMELHIGPPLMPPEPARDPVSVAAVSAWHSVIMTEIARLSGKAWRAPAKDAIP